MRSAESGTLRSTGWGRLLLEKAPFAVLSLAASALAVWAQHNAQALGTQSLSLRLENAAVSYAAYLGKLFWPANLAVFYPYPHSIPMPPGAEGAVGAGGGAGGGGGVGGCGARGSLVGGASGNEAAPLFGSGLVLVSGHAGAGDRIAAGGNAGDGGSLYLYSLYWTGSNRSEERRV